MADLFNECYDGQPISIEDFKQTFCSQCKNQQCDRSRWGKSIWLERMSTQVERLLEKPLYAGLGDSRYEHLTREIFKDMSETAMKLDISSKNKDWAIPEIPILDGRSYTSSATSSQQVEEAVRRMKPPLEVIEDTSLPEETSAPIESSPQRSPQVSSPKNFQTTTPSNTQIPSGGIWLGEDAPSQDIPIQDSPKRDSWEIPQDKILPLGGKVTLGGGK